MPKHHSGLFRNGRNSNSRLCFVPSLCYVVSFTMAKKNVVLILIIFAVTFSYLNLSAKTARRILGTLQSGGSSEYAPVSTPVYFADNQQAEEPLAHRLLAQVFPQTFGGQTQSQHLSQTQTQKQTLSQTQSQTQTQQTQTLYIGFPLQVSWRYKTNGPIIAQPQTDATSVFVAAKSASFTASLKRREPLCGRST